RRLVQQDQSRTGHQRPANGQHLLFASRQVAGWPAPTFPQPREARVHVCEVLLETRPMAICPGAEGVFDAQVSEDTPPFHHVEDSEADDIRRVEAGQRTSVEFYAAGGDAAAVAAE